MHWKTLYLVQKKEARRRGPLVNEDKTKYMQVARVVHNDEHLCCGQHKFEHITEISYLGSQMNQLTLKSLN